MGKKKYAKDPLLYIRQPEIKTPEANMQDHYTTPKKKQEESRNKQKRQGKPIKRQGFKDNSSHHQPFTDGELYEEEDVDIHVDEEKESDEIEESRDEDQGTNRKKFKEMTLTEKVDYLAQRPSYVPNLKCEVKTMERKYRGIITDYKDDHVHMRVGRRNAEIPFDTITDIRLVGF
ncbi:CotO family spore coat protein [Oceanobacillus halotolerans]|uniref:CotO family spore coat protein n=1 Tax=Oceanobacillus halotolerans TaxID=2663380 RepID=UPI0013DC0BAE|nr:CotO family spore coat protein [Oceanobacillus halotolerans]